MNFFDEAALRLKQQLKVKTDREVAKLLGLSPVAWVGRKKRGNFPETDLYALAAKRPDLCVDVDYVLTGITGAPRGLLDAARARSDRASDAGLGFEQLRALAAAQGPGPSPERIKSLGKMLSKLRAIEFENIYGTVQAITELRDALDASSTAPTR